MAIPFPALKERLEARVSGFLSNDFMKTALAAALVNTGEEFANNLVLSLTKLTGWKRAALKNFNRLVFAGLNYFAIKDVLGSGPALVTSIIPISTMIGEGIAYLMGGTPEELAGKAAEKLSAMLRPFGVSSQGAAEAAAPATARSVVVVRRAPAAQPAKAPKTPSTGFAA